MAALLTTMAALWLLHSAFAMRCPAGQFFNVTEQQCELCPPGFWNGSQRTDPINRCQPCAAGTFSAARGLLDSRICRSCPDNTFSQPGAARCTDCPPGTISNIRAGKCLRCGPGSQASSVDPDYFEEKNADKCVPCGRGTYSSGQNNQRCTPCPTNFSSPKGATSEDQCLPCSPGKIAYEGSFGCVPCSVGTFKPGKLGDCEDCPPGFVSEEGSSECTPCPKDTHRSLIRNECVPCKPGTTSNGPAATICRSIGGSCPGGFFETNTGDCNRCSQGYRYNMEEKTCDICPPNTISLGGLRQNCQPCPPGKIPDFFKDQCTCRDGERVGANGECEKCPPGTFSIFDVSFDDNDRLLLMRNCAPCEIGTFQNKSGSEECEQCPLGLVATETGMTQCTTCPSGLVPNIAGDTTGIGRACVLPSTGCPPGWEYNAFGRGEPGYYLCSRVICGVGTPEEDIGVKCVACGAGRKLNENGTRCISCPRDEVSNGGIITKCTKCKNGFRRSQEDFTKCTCPRGNFGVENGVCQRCARGSVSLKDDGPCEKCAAGTIPVYGDCQKCKRDTVTTNAGSTRCRPCPSGTVSNVVGGGTRCVPLSA